VKAALKQSFLEDMPDDQLDKVASAATIVSYSKGDQIIKKVCRPTRSFDGWY
jgi:hypothetical protein